MRRKEFTVEEKCVVLQFLLEGSKNGSLARGRNRAAVLKFGSSKRTISRIWAAAQKMKQAGQPIVLLNGKNNKRKKRVHIDLEFIKALELSKRSTQECLAAQVGCSPSTVGTWLREGLIRAHTSPLRPDLTAPNKLQRVRFSLEHITLDAVTNILRFKGMHNTVHIDEKWFYLTKGVHRYYLTPDEADPHRTCKSKKFITKVMFMCAVARPIFGPDSSVIFDGKIGIWPFTYEEAAKRASKNRAAGTMITKAVESVTKEVVRDCLLNKIIPAIKAKWPTVNDKHVYIQQDNAKPHIKDDDPLFREASIDGGLTFSLIQQPPNSPDTNINDLGFFQSIQSLQHKITSTTLEELVQAVEKSFLDLTAIKLNNVFLTLQGCLLEILQHKGENRYKVPHMGKDTLIREGRLPLNLEVSTNLTQDCLVHLLEAGDDEGVEEMWTQFGFEPAVQEEE